MIGTTPRATARLQFFAGFTMDDAVPVIPYLASLAAFKSPARLHPLLRHCQP
jgi:maltooligosyltrehalose synthase